MLLQTAVAVGMLAFSASAWQPLMHLGRLQGGSRGNIFDPPPGTKPSTSLGGFGATESFFKQKLDHFAKNDTRTWSQRYFSNTQFNKGGSTVFLMLGGDGAERIDWVQNENYPYIGIAKEFGAYVFDLEHRFYGESRPFRTQTVDDLKYLSSRQAIEDIAEFIKFMNVKLNLRNPRWITFGGSYSGSLSLWARQMHPELIAGGVGSSAPVQATFDYFQYLSNVEDVLRISSEACADKVKSGFDQIQTNMASPAGRVILSTTFNLLPAFADSNMTYNDIENFNMVIIRNFQLAAQYNQVNMGPFATSYNITEVCAIMNEAGTELENLAKVNILMNKINNVNISSAGTSNSYNDMVKYLKKDNYTTESAFDFDSGARSWTWQVCSEFGNFQSTSANGIFGAATSMSLFVNLCQDVFGPKFTPNFISGAVDSTNQYYGGRWNYKGTNVIASGGGNDPWYSLFLTSNSMLVDNSVVFFNTMDGAHCADMYPTTSADPPQFQVLNDLIKINIDQWVNSAISNRSYVSQTQPWQRPPSTISFSVVETQHKVVARSVALLEASPSASQHQHFHMGRPPHGFLPAPAGNLPTFPPNYESGFFPQRVDHFNNQNPDKFQQQYFMNGQWAKPGVGLNFLYIGGDFALNPSWLLNENVTYLTWAKQFGATVYGLEHRYYGQSVVSAKKADGTHDLQYLSSLQMLYDIANFIKYVNYKNETGNKWITFGGAYSGSLSLWMREVFPELVIGAVGSSAPVQAKMDFYEYLQVVESSIRSYSLDCYTNIKTAFDRIHTLMLDGPGRKTLSDTFNLLPSFNDVDAITQLQSQFFFYNIYGIFQGAVQYSGINAEGYSTGFGLADMCSIMLNNRKQPLDNVADVNKFMTEFYTGKNFTHTDNSYQVFVDYLKTAETLTTGDAAARYWTWQACREFGYFQTTDNGYSLFGSTIPVNFLSQLCKDVFPDITTLRTEFIDNDIYKTNEQYGGKDNYRGTNIVAPNGSMDPWNPLGQISGSNNTIVWRLINGTAHCADMYPARTEDVADLATVRKLTSDNIAKWIAVKNG